MDAQALRPMEAADIVAGGVFEQRHLDGAALGDLEAHGVDLLECLVSDCQGGDCSLPGLRSTGTTVLGSSFATLATRGATVFSGRLEGVRIGALLMDNSDVSVHKIVASRIDVLSFAHARVRRLEIVDSQIGLLDLRAARVRDVSVIGGSIDELLMPFGGVEDLDVSRTSLGTVLELSTLTGLTLSADQALTLGADLARHMGATVVD